MTVPEDVANMFCQAEKSAESSAPGTVSDAESSRTWSREEEAELTRRQTASGNAESIIVQTIPAPNGLTEAERLELAKIRRNWEKGWLPFYTECQFLLALVEKLTRTRPQEEK